MSGAQGESTTTLPAMWKTGERVITPANEVGYVKRCTAFGIEGVYLNETCWTHQAADLVRWPYGVPRPVALVRRTVKVGA